MSVFGTLSAINVNEHTEQKNGLTYLSWAWAWAEVKKHYPEAFYTIYENADGLFYHTDGRTAWVKTGVTIEGIEHIEYLPVMDYKNRSIPTDNLTSFDVNKAVQRSLTKAAARHGLGLYIYAGEDLPSDEAPKSRAKKETPQTVPQASSVGDEKIEKTHALALAEKCEADNVDSAKLLGLYKVTSFEELTFKMLSNINQHWDEVKTRCAA